MAFFTFPNPVNDKAARTVDTGVVAISVLTLVTGWWWLLVPLALLLPHWIGVNGIFIAEPISDATSGMVAGLLFLITYRRIRRNLV